MSGIDDIRERQKQRKANDLDRPRYHNLIADVDYLLSQLKEGGAEDVKASYSVVHEARYLLTHPVHPGIVVLWFLALKSHWFDDPDNLFYGQRERAKAYLYKWVETGEIADDDNTTLQISVAMKFREWLESSWTTAPTETSARCGECESPILAFEAWLLRWVQDNGRRLTQTEYGIAYAAFIAAHPGEGPQAHVMSTAFPASTEVAGERNKAIETLRALRTDDSTEIERQKESWQQLKADLSAAPVAQPEADPVGVPRCYWCQHPDHGNKVCPVPHLAIGKHGLSGSYPCGCTRSTIIDSKRCAPSTTPPAIAAVEAGSRMIANAVDALLSQRLSPSAYLEQSPSVQDIAEVIRDLVARVQGVIHCRQVHLENEHFYQFGSADSNEEDEYMSSEMAGKMATAACGEVFPTVTQVAKYFDEQLEEVRSVLTSLSGRVNTKEGGHCWCSKNLTVDAEPHNESCQRARTLWERLTNNS